MSRIECRYCLISTSYLPGLSGIFFIFDRIYFIFDTENCVCFGDFLPIKTLCDAYHNEFESH